MIAYLNGLLAEKHTTTVIVDVGGIGYEVFVSLNTFEKIKSLKEVKLFIHHHIREDRQTLYGFHEPSEKSLFRLLITVNGVGTNTAIMMLSSATPDEIVNAIVNEDANLLKKIKGIGAKTAGRIIIELKDKIKSESENTFGTKLVVTSNNNFQEATQALLSLGFSKSEIDKRLKSVKSNETQNLSVEEIVKLVLRN